MPPKSRNRDNLGLPRRWRIRYGAYYYRVPEGQEAHWDGRREFRLGRTLSEAHRVYAERIKGAGTGDTIGDLIDRYLVEVTPRKAPRTQADEVVVFERLKAMIGQNPAAGVKTHHCYQVYDALKKRGLTTANRHIERLSHLFTMALEWGVVTDHPMVGKFRKTRPAPLRRYLSDDQLNLALTTAPPLIRAYVALKLLTGLRMSDMLRLRVRDWQDDGLHVTPGKTLKSSGKSLVFERTPALEAAIKAVQALEGRPHITEYLFCTRDGKPYLKPDGSMNGFQSIWQRWQAKIPDRFKERDIRVKVGSDAESAELAAKLLGHTNTGTTTKFYRAKPEKVKPAK